MIIDADPCLCFRERDDKKLVIVLYVDDGLIETNAIVTGNPCLRLGIEYEKDGVNTFNKKDYTKKTLKRFGFEEWKPIATCMFNEWKSQKTEEIKKVDFGYRQTFGVLM